MTISRLLLVTGLLGLAGCGESSNALVQSTVPANGATGVSLSTQVALQLHPDAVVQVAALQGAARGVVLYDVTGGAKTTVPGTVSAGSSSFEYLPGEALRANRFYRLEVKQAVVGGEGFVQSDGSQWPDEPLSWPYVLRFSTASAPTVRGAYLRLEGGEVRLLVYFSQAMDVLASGGAVQVYAAQTGKPIALPAPVWAGDDQLQLDLTGRLEADGLYTLVVSTEARAADNSRLDGDGDGVAGETGDAFCVSFAGSQALIYSRLGSTSRATCPGG